MREQRERPRRRLGAAEARRVPRHATEHNRPEAGKESEHSVARRDCSNGVRVRQVVRVSLIARPAQARDGRSVRFISA